MLYTIPVIFELYTVEHGGRGCDLCISSDRVRARRTGHKRSAHLSTQLRPFPVAEFPSGKEQSKDEEG